MNDFLDWAASNDYMLMWLLYLLGVVGLLIVAWRLTRSWPRWLSISLRFIGACLLLVPALVDSERGLYAPALVVGPFEWLSKSPEHAEPAVSALIMWTGIALVVIVIAQLGSYFLRRKTATQTRPEADAKTAA
ncbi:MAG: hypothetical protein AB8B48_17130 [Pseudomonadales bacterium]